MTTEVIDVEFRKHPGNPRSELVQHLEEHTKQFSHSNEETIKKFEDAVKRNQQILLEKKEKAALVVQKAKQVQLIGTNFPHYASSTLKNTKKKKQKNCKG
jgi:hypothetical protein